jgi:hypothetical protein
MMPAVGGEAISDVARSTDPLQWRLLGDPLAQRFVAG